MNFQEETNKLIAESTTAKDIFILEQLQSYMCFTPPSTITWNEPVRLRLQEKKDWEERARQAIRKVTENWCGEYTRNYFISEFEKELELN